MNVARGKYGHLLGLLLVLLGAGFLMLLLWNDQNHGLATGAGGKDFTSGGVAARAAGTDTRRKSDWDGERRRWNQPESVGEEGELVEVVYEDGWQLVGERVRGVTTNGVFPYQVPARKIEDIPMFPCSECHKGHNINNRKRELKKEHANLKLAHGGGRFWCDGCHDGRQMDLLFTIDGTPVDMDLGYLLCGQCHFREMDDWQHGVHGKRIGFWEGVRVFRTCTECHNAHSPEFQPIAPDPPPGVPKGRPPPVQHSNHRIELIRHLAVEKEQP